MSKNCGIIALASLMNGQPTLTGKALKIWLCGDAGHCNQKRGT
jgi:hypothetical protein